MIDQSTLDLRGDRRAEEILARIREESRDESEKGLWFEELFMRIALQERELDIGEIWRWVDWPMREELTGLDGQDIGIDLVARHLTGKWVAIQCKCYDLKHKLGKGEVDKFLGGSQQGVFELRWIVTTCQWGPNAKKAIRRAKPQVSRIDFSRFYDVQVSERIRERPVQEPWELQKVAIEDTIEGLKNHNRGRLVMACGTGKTFTALRVCEDVVEDNQRILFAAPTIALVSQARREWLRHTRRESLECLVVCSDSSAGGRHENEDMSVSELECPVTTDPAAIAQVLKKEEPTRVVFCTYHSLQRVIEAQKQHGAPEFALAIADEAHRTTGITEQKVSGQKVNFRDFHDEQSLQASKRLYMTATPRIYTASSKRNMEGRGYEVVDMGDSKVYGPEFHCLPFATAVDNGMLSDYRVIVLGVSHGGVTPGLKRRLERIGEQEGQNYVGSVDEMTRVLGVSLAVNGVTEGDEVERPSKLRRTMAFANSIKRSKWFAEALMEPEVLRRVTRQMEEGKAMKVVARHLDASASARKRHQELRALANANKESECRIVCNVKLFTEGVDVPSLDAVAFLDPRESHVDVVQAVGRVMRRAEGKRFGYIVVPVIVPPDADVVDALIDGPEGYKTVGRVLRALQAHDGRLAKDPEMFVKIYEARFTQGEGLGPGGEAGPYPQSLDLQEVGQNIYAHVAAASGLGKPGALVADEIGYAVRRASYILKESTLETALGDALDLMPKEDGGAKGICTIAALLLCNACLLHRRLRDTSGMRFILRLTRVGGASNPKEMLEAAWESILEKDYAPVFKPALAVLKALPETETVASVIRELAECANRIADSLSELGYDHAGPLYHRILGSAKSDGAYYTNNISALMLARLALWDDFIDWSDREAVRNLKIIDPACGTGTLLMAALQTVKSRIGETSEIDEQEHDALHKELVERVLCGLDINQHAIQLAACNMTLGAPTVDYEQMNLHAMQHGLNGEGEARAGALEILATIKGEATRDNFLALTQSVRGLEHLDAQHVTMGGGGEDFPMQDVDLVIMNPPFTDNAKRGRKFGKKVLRKMQDRELHIRNEIAATDGTAGDAITTNSISTFFTPLADMLLKSGQATLAKIVPTTACIGADGRKERQFLAERFHVERVITSHDPKRINFSDNTSIHESLLICRRSAMKESNETEFVALSRMPEKWEDAIEVADLISGGQVGEWGSVTKWPRDRVASGDWSPVQWFSGVLTNACKEIENLKGLDKLGQRHTTGPTGRAAQDSWKRCPNEDDPRAVQIFDSISGDLRKTMAAEPEQWVAPGGRREHLWQRVLSGSGHLFVATRMNTQSGRVSAIYSQQKTFGFGWIPVSVSDEREGKALCVWWNSTLARLLLLNRRAKTLTYPKWSVKHILSMPVPRLESAAVRELVSAWDKTCRTEFLQMKYGDEDKARRVIDDAVAEVVGLEKDKVSGWRCLLAKEPTVSGERHIG